LEVVAADGEDRRPAVSECNMKTKEKMMQNVAGRCITESRRFERMVRTIKSTEMVRFGAK